MRKILFIILVAVSPLTYAMQAQDLAKALITGTNQTNEYGGITRKDVSCSASFSIRDGKLEAFITWGDTGARVRSELDAPATVVSNSNGVTVVQVAQFDEPTTTLTLTIKNRVITAMSVDGVDRILGFIPRKFHVPCDELEQFIPKYR